jgi:uncharacterized protein YjdB
MKKFRTWPLRLMACCLMAAFIQVAFSQDVNISVDANAITKAISPYIYGKNNSTSDNPSKPTTAQEWTRIKDSGARILRENSGNNSTKRNWQKNITSAPDWYNNCYTSDWDYEAAQLQQNHPTVQAMFGFQLIGKAAANTSNNFNDWGYNSSQWWTGVHQNLAGGGTPNTSGGSKALVEGNPELYLEDYTPTKSTEILDHWFGSGGLGLDKTKLQYWSMDNEPEIWSSTHDDIQPTPTFEQYIQNYFEAAKSARAKYPNIKLVGPMAANEWQWYAKWGGSTLGCLEAFIKRIGEEQKATGIRLLDVLSVHFYPGSTNAADVVQYHRVFFDKTYNFPEANGVYQVNGGWDTNIKQEYVLERCREWLVKYIGPDHGVTFGVTEAGIKPTDPNVVASWYASTIGEFMKNGVEVFTPWTWKVGMWEVLHLLSRYNKPLYLPASSDNETYVSAYPSMNAQSDSLVVVLVNRSLSNTHNAIINPSNFTLNNESFKVLTLKGLSGSETFVSHTQNALQSSTVTKTNNTVKLSLAPLSITTVILTGSESTGTPVTGVALSPASASVPVGGTVQLTATVSPSNATNKSVSWSSNNTSVATVNASGLVSGIAAGSATITVTTQDGSKSATCAVTVNSTTVPVSSVTVTPSTASINVGATTQLTATVSPSNASNKNVSWSSNNTSVATVSATGLVSGIAAGSATIVVTTQDGSFKANCAVTVTTGGSLTVYQAEDRTSQYGTVIASSHSGYTGSGYVDYGGNGTWIEWNNVSASSAGTVNLVFRYANGSTGRPCEVRVNGNAIGNLNLATTGGWATWGTETISANLNAGNNTIRVIAGTAGGPNVDKMEFTGGTTTVPVSSVTVSPSTVSVNVGATTQLSASVSPSNATNKTVSWSSNNTSVATVSATGLVSGIAAGSATITVTTQDGSKTATCAVTVNSTTVPVSSVTVTPSTASLNVGATTQLAATVSPSNATNKTVSWSSNNTSVATVSATGLVSGIAAGSATITATTQDGAKTSHCVVTVTSSTVSSVFEAENYTAQYGNTIASSHKGYSGSGYVDYGWSGTWIEWNNVNANASGTVSLIIRYANGSSERPCRVEVNGTSIGTLSMAKTGTWSSWGTESINANLNAGNNTVRIIAGSAGGPNIDKMDISGLRSSELLTANMGPLTVGIYPNPVTGQSIKIHVATDESSDVQLVIYNQLGQKVVAKELGRVDSGNALFEMTNILDAGLYLFEVKTNKEKIWQRVLVP